MTDACLYTISTGLAVQKKASFVSMDADGFTVSYSASTSPNATQVVSLALEGVAAKAGIFLKSATVPPAGAYVQSQSFTTSANVTSASVTLPAASTTGDLIVVSFNYVNRSAVASSVTIPRATRTRERWGRRTLEVRTGCTRTMPRT